MTRPTPVDAGTDRGRRMHDQLADILAAHLRRIDNEQHEQEQAAGPGDAA